MKTIDEINILNFEYKLLLDIKDVKDRLRLFSTIKLIRILS